MSEDAGLTYTTKQIANSLSLGTAMVRKWAIALETATGQEIPMTRRDGRSFSREHFETIAKAKALVDNENGLSVNTALKMVLGQGAALAVNPGAAPVDTPALDHDAFAAAIAKGNEPLLAELRELRLEMRQARQIDKPVANDVTHGLLVRLALRVESWLRR